jgi:hypothetical protein
MPFEVYRTTAEQIIAATDAALQNLKGIDAQTISLFLDTAQEFARDALKMAVQLGLLTEQNQDEFVAGSPCSKYLVTSVREEKAAVFRFVLEQYKPFSVFKQRLDLATGVVGEAATQTKALCAITAHRDVVASTLIDLGTYARALTSQGAGLYLASEGRNTEFLRVMDNVLADRQNTELFICRRLERGAAEWIERDGVLENLITAYQRLKAVSEDARAPIVHAGNAVESFLVQLAAHYHTNIENAPGINAKAERLGQANHLSTKHKNMLKYLGHIRNAADHGVDTEVGQQWSIRESTTIEYVHVALSAIGDLVDAKNGKFIV